MGQSIDKIERCYNTIASEYAVHFVDEHGRKAMDCTVLKRFAEMTDNQSPVWDLGCGPGHTAAWLHSLGVDIAGLDLSAAIIGEAKRRYPHIEFHQGSMLNTGFADDSVAAIVSFYAIVHFSPGQVAAAFREMRRVLRDSAPVLLTYHIGDSTMCLTEFLGRDIDIDFMFFPTAFIVNTLRQNGFDIIECMEREPYPEVEYQSRRAYVFARKNRQTGTANNGKRAGDSP